MDTIKLSLEIVNASEFHNLGIELWVDKNKFFDNTISPGTHVVMHEFQINDGDHWFKIFLKNKNKLVSNEHTKIDQNGQIISDAMIQIKNVCLDGINIDQLLCELGEYVHDNNGDETIAIHDFYGTLGCNGRVQLKFSAPVYAWLLENM